MTRLNRQGKRAAIITVMLLALAITCRMLGNNGFYPLTMGLIRSGIYIFLFAAWAVLLNRRIIQVQLRRYMIGIAGSMAFWFLLRTLKYHIIVDGSFPDMRRLIWYAYYIPMLMLPMLALFAAVSLGKPERYRTPFPLRLLWIPAALLACTVLTNDLHQMVFSFPTEYPVGTDDHYHYEIMYWIVLAWIVVSVLLAFGIILYKCRIPRSKTFLWLPMIPFSLMIAYGILYITAHSVIAPFVGDMTAANCVLIALFFESCIQCGLIQSNSHYTELFQASTIAAQITDKDYKSCVFSDAAQPVASELLCQAQIAPVMLSGDIRLSGTPIRGGYIFWQEDVSELISVLNALGDTRDELKDYSQLLAEETRQKKRRRELEERKRLYDAVQCKVFPQVKQLEELLGQLRAVEDTDEAKMLYSKIAVIGAYLKRRSNLIFLADQTGRVDTRELFLCLNESVSNLRLAGVSCSVQFDLDGTIEGETAGMLYDFFETVMEIVYDELTGLNVIVTYKGAGVHILLMLKYSADLSTALERFPEAIIEQDDGICYCSLTVQEGGASA